MTSNLYLPNSTSFIIIIIVIIIIIIIIIIIWQYKTLECCLHYE